MTQIEHDTRTNPAFEQEVRAMAYFLWEQDGRPEGRDDHFWFQALERCRRRGERDAALTNPAGESKGQQLDDNIDDLGRSATDPKGPPLDQPV
ncbi:MAG: DUF2934 domain-containing protein [Devosia sp.]|nr:DUF2934 domain-containing protein [Devosia sp.]